MAKLIIAPSFVIPGERREAARGKGTQEMKVSGLHALLCERAS
jgi:hypothetical protein